ncbi:MAG: DUF3570 domain-containing protein [Sandaracinaceae bacterium]
MAGLVALAAPAPLAAQAIDPGPGHEQAALDAPALDRAGHEGAALAVATAAPATLDPGDVPPPPHAAPAAADPVIEEGGGGMSWALEQIGFRVAIFDQEGRGLQSQAADDPWERGSEEAFIFQPMLYFGLRQSETIDHQVTIPIDIVSAASTDALDAVSRASLLNEAGGVDITTSIEDGEDQTWQLRYGTHLEEPFWSGFLGGAYVRELADDNATLRASLDVVFDTFDPIDHNGIDLGFAHRLTTSANVGLSQLLSPTTVVYGSYGLTVQVGRLETTWNSVPRADGGRVQDRWPDRRIRHALRGEIRQLIPATRTVVAADYRLYLDSFDVMSHTAEAVVTQHLGDLWIRGAYRFHTQSAPFFWTPRFDGNNRDPEFRTADSDLEALDAHQIRLSLRWFYDRQGALTAGSSYLQLGHTWYWRTNSLRLNMLSFDWGASF